MKTNQSDQCIDACNSLLRGEISAIETYNQAIEHFQGSLEVSLLEDLRREHVSSANRLRENIRAMGGEPSTDSGPWGTWARAVEGTAKAMGDSPALKALQEGEEHGAKEYQSALESDALMPSSKELIRNELLPRQRRHVNIVRGLMNAQ